VVISNPDQIVIDFFPETGLFVSGVPNKVYFAAYINEERYDIIDFTKGSLIKINENGIEDVVAESIKT